MMEFRRVAQKQSWDGDPWASRVASWRSRALEKKAWGLEMMPSSPSSRAAFCWSRAHGQLHTGSIR